ncbi:MAG: Lrp/AsnC family transcriptional regulator [Methylococcaceae bacterium]|jgi:DNA-binding Lrp family transcriptional regulator|nr:Lrp/AsnC family transcriptional regulator [Methylococcaceae bacterium]
METTGLRQRLLNDFQRNFPLTPRPYADLAERLGVTEDEMLDALRQLTEERIISRVGAIFPPNTVGVSLLAALALPQEQLGAVADWITALPEVNHNYEREHRFNLWFVVTASDAVHLERVLERIEAHAGYSVLRLPLLEEFHIDLGFPLDFARPA